VGWGWTLDYLVMNFGCVMSLKIRDCFCHKSQPILTNTASGTVFALLEVAIHVSLKNIDLK
jgi:hypothetical protein